MSAAASCQAVGAQRADGGAAGCARKRTRDGAADGLRETADIVLVLAAMSQMRGGRPPGTLERDLAGQAFQRLAQCISSLSPEVLLSKELVETLIEELGLRKTPRRDDPSGAEKKDDHVGGVAEEMQKAINKQDGACAFSTEERDLDVAYAHTDFSEPVNSAGLSGLGDDGDDSDDVSDSEMSSMVAMQTTPPGLAPAMYAQTFNNAIAQHESREMGGLHGMMPIPSTKDIRAPVSHPKPFAAVIPPNAPRPIGRPRKDGLTGYSLFRPMPLPADQDACSKLLGLAVQQYITMKNNALRVTPVLLSNAYMSPPVPCESCKLIVKDAVSALICDTCEQAYHLKCVSTFTLGKIPEGDWDCPKCLRLNRGRLPTPKYGPLRKIPGRNPPASFASQSNGELGKAPEGSVPSSGQGEAKDLHQKRLEPKTVEAKDPAPERVDAEQTDLKQTGTPQKDLKQQAHGATPNLKIRFKTRKVNDGGKEEMSDSSTRNNSEKVLREEAATDAKMSAESDAEAQLDTLVQSDSRGGPDDVVKMDWVGDSLHEADGKVYYGACRVGDHLFKVNDYALFRPESAEVPPYIARLQTMWEDTALSSKWVKVNWCYYPGDIPVVVGRPSEPEPDEVYESNHCDNNLLGSIQGPCEVLTALKFRDERERRAELQRKDPAQLVGLSPIFVCRWLYDAPRGTFGLAPEDVTLK